jgi:hypothetical protein
MFLLVPDVSLCRLSIESNRVWSPEDFTTPYPFSIKRKTCKRILHLDNWFQGPNDILSCAIFKFVIPNTSRHIDKCVFYLMEKHQWPDHAVQHKKTVEWKLASLVTLIGLSGSTEKGAEMKVKGNGSSVLIICWVQTLPLGNALGLMIHMALLWSTTP